MPLEETVHQPVIIFRHIRPVNGRFHLENAISGANHWITNTALHNPLIRSCRNPPRPVIVLFSVKSFKYQNRVNEIKFPQKPTTQISQTTSFPCKGMSL